MRTVSADLDIPARDAWALYARPQAWPAWAPHVRGAWRLADRRGEVGAGHTGLVFVLGAPPVPATITWVDPGRSWSWRVGPLEMDHVVEERENGCRVALAFRGPAPLERLVALTYGAPAQLLLRNMGRVGRRASGRRPAVPSS